MSVKISEVPIESGMEQVSDDTSKNDNDKNDKDEHKQNHNQNDNHENNNPPDTLMKKIRNIMN